MDQRRMNWRWVPAEKAALPISNSSNGAAANSQARGDLPLGKLPFVEQPIDFVDESDCEHSGSDW
jgi:hypothetical protein